MVVIVVQYPDRYEVSRTKFKRKIASQGLQDTGERWKNILRVLKNAAVVKTDPCRV